ncbi:DUF2190 family protein [Amorphus sp. 3PC139-8]|uniref:DUF2190 family protein n=1 Tax=Amorphus sp. 3PC139-8 TaxID=2735676 RepID=UPI00345DDBC1
MKDYVKPGKVITITAPAGGVSSGDGVLIGSLFGVAAYGTAEGDPVEIMTEDVHMLDKTSAQAWSVGDLIYWDATAGKATKVAAGNSLIGAAVADAANPTDYGMVRLNGTTADPSGAITQAAAVADLTEDGGAIGGTNDGDLPDVSGTASGTDAAIVTALQATVRELAAKQNELQGALRTAGQLASS